MRAYVYKPADLAWSAGFIRIDDNVELVNDPTQADIFICTDELSKFETPASLERLPYLAGNEAHHLFFDIKDNFDTIYDKPCLFMRCNLKTWMKARDVNSVSWPWPVDDFAECVDLPEGGFKYDISFHGWRYSPSRLGSTASCEQSGLKTDMLFHDDFTGKYLKRGEESGEGLKRRAAFIRSMRESRVALCPEQIPGDIPYRFFEAMSAGRIPVMVGSEYVLPFADEIPYSSFILEIPRTEAGSAGAIILQFLSDKSDEEIQVRGLMGRQYWLKWLWRDEWARTMRYVVDKHMNGLMRQ